MWGDGSFDWDIGTAGSATMLALSVLPVACFAAAPVQARITGGSFHDFAPSSIHMDRVLAPLLRAMGADVSLNVTRPRYLPGGGGIIEMKVNPRRWAERRVSERMASTCEEQIRGAGMACAIFLGDVRSGATVDRHLADQLVLFCALARGTSTLARASAPAGW